MLEFPLIDPVAISLGPFQVRWYGLMYLIGFAAFWLLGIHRAGSPDSHITKEQVGDLLFYGVLGAILGGRVGYMLAYNFARLMEEPLALFYVWQGGMSFHGGLAGVALAMWWFSKQKNLRFLQVADFSAPLVPIGIGAGRIGNFINGELWGRVSDVPWAMVFPQADPFPRHPSQLYEFLLEGVVLFVVLWIYSKQPRRLGQVSGLFLILYAAMRSGVELFREPDAHIGFVAFEWLTLGQLLSLPLLILGIILFRAKTMAGERS